MFILIVTFVIPTLSIVLSLHIILNIVIIFDAILFLNYYYYNIVGIYIIYIYIEYT
jgi:hypothetical protein